MTWMDSAREHIARLMADVPETAGLAERRRILRAYSSSFHGGTSWGKKVWPRACREYLARYGYKSVDEIPRRHLSPMERIMLASEKHRAKVNASLPYKEKPE